MPVAKKGALRLEGLPEALKKMPSLHKDGLRMYAVGLVDGRTKLGYASRVRSRLVAINRFTPIAWAHVFSSPVNARDVEQLALKKAALVSSRERNTEYFHGLSKEDAIACVRAAANELASRPSPSTEGRGLCDLYADLSMAERRALAEKAGIAFEWLYQISTKRRKPSLQVLHRLSSADARLDLSKLVEEFSQ